MKLPLFLTELGFTCWAHVFMQATMVITMIVLLRLMYLDARKSYRLYKRTKRKIKQ
jgi:hypothetical protein